MKLCSNKEVQPSAEVSLELRSAACCSFDELGFNWNASGHRFLLQLSYRWAVSHDKATVTSGG